MSYYKHHVFFCCNQRAEGETCCNAQGASELQAYAKDRVAALGPIIVVYPEEIWYHYVDKEDIEEIIQEHLVQGRVVERLKI